MRHHPTTTLSSDNAQPLNPCNNTELCIETRIWVKETVDTNQTINWQTRIFTFLIRIELDKPYGLTSFKFLFFKVQENQQKREMLP